MVLGPEWRPLRVAPSVAALGSAGKIGGVLRVETKGRLGVSRFARVPDAEDDVKCPDAEFLRRVLQWKIAQQGDLRRQYRAPDPNRRRPQRRARPPLADASTLSDRQRPPSRATGFHRQRAPLRVGRHPAMPQRLPEPTRAAARDPVSRHRRIARSTLESRSGTMQGLERRGGKRLAPPATLLHVLRVERRFPGEELV